MDSTITGCTCTYVAERFTVHVRSFWQPPIRLLARARRADERHERSTPKSREVIQVAIRSRSSLLEDALSAGASQLTVSRSSRVTTPVLRLVGQPQPGPQRMFDETEADIAILGGAAGGGKMLALDTPIPTPDGWKLVRDLREDDLVFSEKGEPTPIVQLHPIDLQPESYRLVFDDGSEVVACADHLWLTFNAEELSALTRRDPEWRARRRERRPSRMVAGRGWLADRNREDNPAITLPAPKGSIRTTSTIAATIRLSNGRRNHAIPVADALQLPHVDLPLDPYILGIWLGDGTTVDGSVTTADPEVVDALHRAGFQPRRRPAAGSPTYGTVGLAAVLRWVGVLGNKHVPSEYLRSSEAQRLALLQGLMDSDGFAPKTGGKVEFCNTNRGLAEAVYELAASLGQKPTLREGRAMLRGVDCGPKYRVCWSPTIPVFRLPRKLGRLRVDRRRTVRFRYIVSCERIPPVPMRCLTVDNATGLFLCGRAMIPTHNTWALLREPVRHVHNPRFGAVIFRRTYPEIKKEGGMWDESLTMYGLIGATAKETSLEWKFTSGAKISFGHMQHEKDKLSWKGGQIPFIGFDQLEDFSETQFFYMLSRNRSTSGVRPYIRATCNPDADSWLATFIGWWIDQETGYPIPERAGVLRWFVRVDGVIIWGDSAEELLEAHPEQLAKSVTFIPAKLEDNKILEAIDPGYRANLMALTFVERERLLGGNWKIRALAGLVFDRSNFDIVDAIPAGITERVRYWDKAGTDEQENPGAAFSAGVRMSYHRSTGIFYVENVVRGQWSALARERQIKQTAELDGKGIPVWVEQEPGSGGKESAERTIQNLAGWNARKEAVTGDKLTRAGPYSAQAEARNVKLLRGDWNESFLAEHHSFPTGKLKDQVDASSGAFNKLVLGEYLDPTAFTASKR